MVRTSTGAVSRGTKHQAFQRIRNLSSGERHCYITMKKGQWLHESICSHESGLCDAILRPERATSCLSMYDLHFFTSEKPISTLDWRREIDLAPALEVCVSCRGQGITNQSAEFQQLASVSLCPMEASGSCNSYHISV